MIQITDATIEQSIYNVAGGGVFFDNTCYSYYITRSLYIYIN